MKHNRRKYFFVYKGLQTRYLLYIVIILSLVSGAGIVGSYFGVWGSILKSFSEKEIRETIITAARIYEYETARHPQTNKEPLSSLRVFKETELLSDRQKEVLQQILNDTYSQLIRLGLLLLFFIAWGSIFLTHKVAGPLFRFTKSFEELKSGNLTLRIHLRKWDETKGLANIFNDTISVLDHRISKLKQLASQKSSPEVLQEIQHELSKFKTSTL
nr:histidine kinase, HAMP region [uncultured bacterium]